MQSRWPIKHSVIEIRNKKIRSEPNPRELNRQAGYIFKVLYDWQMALSNSFLERYRKQKTSACVNLSQWL